MRRNRAAEKALREAVTASDEFVDAVILHPPGCGRTSLNAFEAEGWIEKVEPITLYRQKYRITPLGRDALKALDNPP